MAKKPKGSLIIIGGAEDKEGDAEILKEVARRATKGLTVVTVATHLPEEVAAEYKKVFRDLGVKEINVVDIRLREDACSEKYIDQIIKSSVVFFTGGDQLRITSQIGDSILFRCMRDMFTDGGTIVGTSAGAAAMSGTMLVSGRGDASAEISAIGMAPGLGFLPDAVIDSHFAERGRIGRLLGAVAQNPKNLGIGIDEDTAIIVDRETSFRVMGTGGVYVADGSDVSYSSLSEKRAEGVLSIYDVKLHVLSDGDKFDLIERQPVIPREAEAIAS